MFPSHPGLLALILPLALGSLSQESVGSRAGEQTPPGEVTGSAVDPSELEEVRNLLQSGRFAEGESRARALLERVEAAAGPESLAAAEVLDLLVESLWRGGKTADPETRRLAQRTVAIKEGMLGPADLGLATSLNNLGIVCSDAGDYDSARSAYGRVLAIREGSLGPEHPDVAKVLNNLGVVAFHRGEFAEARALHERALGIRERALGPNHGDVATDLRNLATVVRSLGDYPLARSLLERALPIAEAARGPEHPYVAALLSDLGWILAALGDEAEALPLYERALALGERGFGNQHPAVARILMGYADALVLSGDAGRARTLLERALAIGEGKHDPDHAHIAETLTRLADVIALEGAAEPAEGLYERAVRIWQESVGSDHPGLAEALHGLARLRWKSGEDAEVEGLLRRALAIGETALGSDHPGLAGILLDLATLRVRTEEGGSAGTYALRAETIRRDHTRLTLQSLPERVALRYAARGARGLDVAISLATRGSDPSRVRSAWDALIRSRAIVLDEMASRHRGLAGEVSPVIAGPAERLLSARTRLANLLIRGPGETDPEQYRRLLEEGRREKEAAERVAASASRRFAEDIRRERIGLDEVAAALPPDTALLAFARYRHPSEEGDLAASEDRYMAFVLGTGAMEPAAIPLGPAAPIDAEVRVWREEIGSVRARIGRSGRAVEDRYRAVAEPLRRKVWDPIEPRLRSARQVFIVPDGVLFFVNWAAFPAGVGDYLIRAGPLLHYLSAERDLVPREESRPEQRKGSLLALGGPEFGTASGDGLPVETGAGASAEKASPPKPGPACGGFSSLRFPPLPGARAEAERIFAQWRAGTVAESTNAGGILLVGAEAGESRVKREASRHAILHLATHGFFLSGTCPAAGAKDSGPGPAPVRESLLSPLLLSGLALAGANRRLEDNPAGEGVEDGFLTSEEIASLDLSRVDWAVLSACGSAVGDLQIGEGVLGLRRAFQLAGARTLIMSLWDVDDDSGGRWIAALYRNRLGSGATTAEAARAASLEVLLAREEAGLNTHPFFWAGFIAAGDWR